MVSDRPKLASTTELDNLATSDKYTIRAKRAYRNARGYFVPNLQFSLTGYPADPQHGEQPDKAVHDLLDAEAEYHKRVTDYNNLKWWQRVRGRASAPAPFNLTENEKQAVYATLKGQIALAETQQRVEAIFNTYNGKKTAKHIQAYLVNACQERLLELVKDPTVKPESVAEKKEAKASDSTTNLSAVDAQAATKLKKDQAATSGIFSTGHGGYFSGVSSTRRESFDKTAQTFTAEEKQKIGEDLVGKIKDAKYTDFDELYRHMSQPYITSRRTLQFSFLESRYYPNTRIKALNAFRARALELVVKEQQEQKDNPEKAHAMAVFFLSHDAFADIHNNKYGYRSAEPIKNNKDDLIKARDTASAAIAAKNGIAPPRR